MLLARNLGLCGMLVRLRCHFDTDIDSCMIQDSLPKALTVSAYSKRNIDDWLDRLHRRTAVLLALFCTCDKRYTMPGASVQLSHRVESIPVRIRSFWVWKLLQRRIMPQDECHELFFGMTGIETSFGTLPSYRMCHS